MREDRRQVLVICVAVITALAGCATPIEIPEHADQLVPPRGGSDGGQPGYGDRSPTPPPGPDMAAEDWDGPNPTDVPDGGAAGEGFPDSGLADASGEALVGDLQTVDADASDGPPPDALGDVATDDATTLGDTAPGGDDA